MLSQIDIDVDVDTYIDVDVDVDVDIDIHPVRLIVSAMLISHDTLFFSHNKTTSVGLSATKTISQTTSTVRTVLKFTINELASKKKDVGSRLSNDEK